MGRVCIAVGRTDAARPFEYNYGNLEREEVQARAMADVLELLTATLEAT